MEETAIPYDSHIVLHGASHLRPTMVLQYGDVDPCVRLDQGLMDLGAFQVHATRNGYFLKIFLIVGMMIPPASFTASAIPLVS